MLPLFGLIYFTVCGGSFGIEPLVGWSGPGLALLLVAITPLVFSIPNMLMVRELQSMMPVEGGYYHWIKQAFGPFAGFMAGWMNWVVSWVDVTIYPVLATYYLGYFIPALREGAVIFGIDVSPALLSFMVAALLIWLISLLQMRGARLAGLTTNWLGVIMLIPLGFLTVVGLYNWFQAGSGPTPPLPFLAGEDGLISALSVGLFVVMWNYMGWELPSAAGDEIVNPRKTYPLRHGAHAGRRRPHLQPAVGRRAYTVGPPTMDATPSGASKNTKTARESALSPPTMASAKSSCSPGVLTLPARSDGSSPISPIVWAKWPPVRTAAWPASWASRSRFSAVLSMIGLFIGNSLGGTRVPFALAEDGMMPKWLVRVHPRYGTPWVAILLCAVIFTIFSLQAFAFLVVVDVFLQTLVILMEFAALWKFRRTMPDVPRDTGSRRRARPDPRHAWPYRHHPARDLQSDFRGGPAARSVWR